MMKSKKRILHGLVLTVLALSFTACKSLKLTEKKANTNVPASYANSQDTSNNAEVKWQDYFTDPYLNALIDSALKNNQELNITMQEIAVTKNEIRARKGEYLPFVNASAGAGLDKVGRYTRNGALEATTDIKPGTAFPEPLNDYQFGATATWELDIWHKLRNAKKAAVSRYLSSIEGKNFMVTNLVAEIASAYYELLALDNQLAIIQENIKIQNKALQIVKMQKQAAKVTDLAVRKFEAEVLKNRSLQFAVQQDITVTENRLNFLIGRYPTPILRNATTFSSLIPKKIQEGIPAQLLANRPDIRQQEYMLAAAKLDVKVARARFYPSIGIVGGIGFQAFNPQYLVQAPTSLMYNLAGDLIAPLINRNAIKAAYYSANSKQIQAVYSYERSILNAYIEVSNQLSSINNLEKSYDLKSQQVAALTKSIAISTSLFKSARADYMEVLLTQRDALEAKIELIETKKQQMNAFVKMYQALGGGWK